MLCSLCQNEEATINIQEVVDGKKRSLHLCNTCAEKKRMAPDLADGLSLAELLYNLSSDESGNVYDDDEAAVISCPACGLTNLQFQQTGRLGCVDCYKAFHSILVDALPELHKASLHVGKQLRPGKLNTAPLSDRQPMASMAMKRINIQKRLEEAVADEDFECAARLRDQLSMLEHDEEPNQPATEGRHHA